MSLLEEGRKLSHYEILGSLGAGGMGEVYLARDTTLERKVALKVLPPELADDASYQRRFEREAKAIAALNHPNIVQVYSVEQADGFHFITMELVEGRSLGEHIEDGGMALDHFFRVAIPLATGLAAAHRKGILHRDIKPTNVLISWEGGVKVLDFGLAKSVVTGDLSEAATMEQEEPATREGAVIGTLPYMSPEQAEGSAVDARSDVFSLGAVLYEMLTGERPFTGKTPLALLASITRDDPAPLDRKFPDVLSSLVIRALAKKPGSRFQTMDGVVDALVGARESSRSGSGLKRIVASAAAVVGLLVAGSVVSRFVGTESEPTIAVADLPPVEVSAFTSDEGVENWPALSPTGNLVAFVWNQTSRPDGGELYVKPVGSGRRLQLTELGNGVYSPVWSPDETEIAFIGHREDDGDAVLIIPFTGGAARELGSADGHSLAWSPDGEHLVVEKAREADNSIGLSLLSTRTGEERALTDPQVVGLHDLYPALSPDGQSLVFVRRNDFGDGDVYVYRFADEDLRRVKERRMVQSLAWTPDGRELVMSSMLQGAFRLSKLTLAGEETLVTFGEGATRFSVARTASRLVYVRDWVPMNNSSLSRIPFPLPGRNGGNDPISVESISRATLPDNGPRYSADGNRIAFDSWRGGRPSFWTCSADGEDCAAFDVTSDEIQGWGRPRFSRDGRLLAFNGWDRSTVFSIYVVPANGGVPRRLTEGTYNASDPEFSVDGSWVYFNSLREDGRNLYRVPVAGGEVERITSSWGDRPRASPDGRYIYYGKRRAREGLWRIPVDGGDEELVLDETVSSLNWDWRGDGMVYAVNDHDHGMVVYSFDPATGARQKLAELGADVRIGGGLAVSPDEQWILFSRSRPPEGDLVLIENFQ